MRNASVSHAACGIVAATALLALAACSPWALPGGRDPAAPPATIEIDQASVLRGSAHDAPGFPLELRAPGHYRLRGDLAVPAGRNGVVITAPGVTLDLAGHTIAAPGRCTEEGAALHCVHEAPAGQVHGVIVQSTGATVRNGRVQGFSGMGIVLQTPARLEDLATAHNAAHGVHANTSASQPVYVSRVRASQNGGDGFWLQTGELVDCEASNNGRAGFALGAQMQWRNSQAHGNRAPDGDQIAPAPRTVATTALRLRAPA